MVKIPVMKAVIDILESEGVEVIFGIPGAGILPFYQALQDSKTITHYLMRHEEGATHAADGYARATGKVGVCVGTSGPAGTNMITGLYTAQVDSIPIIAITGQNVTALLGKEAFQAVDIAEIAKPVAKKTYCVKETAQLPQIFREAFRIAQENRPGPILIDLPLDVQKGMINYDSELDQPLEMLTPTPNLMKIEKAMDLLLQAKKPIIVAGGGIIISEASKQLAEFAEYLAIPVVTTTMGKGCIREDHPLFAGQVGVFCDQPPGNKYFLDSDLVLGIGCRFSDRHTGSLEVYAKDRKFIHIDICPTQIGRIIPAHLGIVSDAKLALQALLQVASGKSSVRVPSPAVKDIPMLRETMARRVDFPDIPIKPQRVFKEINEVFDENTIFVTTIGLNQIFSTQLQRVFQPRHYIVCGGAGPLGWDLPAAIGVQIAKPDHLVVEITGDYGFGFMCEELAVAAMYDVPVKCIILNDGHLGLIRQAEELFYNMHFEVDTWYEKQPSKIVQPVIARSRVSDDPPIRNMQRLVDFVKFAEAYGVPAETIEKPTDIKPALQRAMNISGPYIINIIIDRATDASTGASIDKIIERE
jgi:tartronate-semialdehyde synthase